MSSQLAIQFIMPQNGEILRHERSIFIRVYVTLSCGAPTCAGGRYDARNFHVTAKLFRDGIQVGASNMSFAGDVSEFTCEIPLHGSGRYELMISAMDRDSGMAGGVRCNFEVRS